MTKVPRLPWPGGRERAIVVVTGVLALAAALGARPSSAIVAGLLAALATGALVSFPDLALPTLALAALLANREISTGTEVRLNLATLLVPLLLTMWLLGMALRKQIRLAPSATNLPLFLFLVASLLSLLIGAATWDPTVPRKSNLLLVQLSQWAIFAFSAGAFWLAGNVVRNQRRLEIFTAAFLAVGGAGALLKVIPPTAGLAAGVTTLAFGRAPFWMLLTAVAGGQLLFNRRLGLPARAFLLASLAAALIYAFDLQQEAASNWVGVGAALGTLFWLRFPRLRWPLVIVTLALTLTGLLFPAVYRFAGGDGEWQLTGGSRVVLIRRVVEVTMRNPVTGLGPAAYRSYAGMQPLPYLRAYWLQPQVNSHNNYVDLFAHGGLLGLALFAWFAAALGVAGVRLRTRYPDGFMGGYVNAALAAGAGSLVLMLMADWILPHVYNIGFPGFQASVLVWLFLGGIVALGQAEFQAANAVEATRRPPGDRAG